MTTYKYEICHVTDQNGSLRWKTPPTCVLFYISKTTMLDPFNGYKHTSNVVVVTGIDSSISYKKYGYLSFCRYPFDIELTNIEEESNEIMNYISESVADKTKNLDDRVLETNEIYDTYQCLSKVSREDLLTYTKNLNNLKTLEKTKSLKSQMIDSAIRLCNHHLNIFKSDTTPTEVYLDCSKYLKEMKEFMIMAGARHKEKNIKSNTTGVNTIGFSNPVLKLLGFSGNASDVSDNVQQITGLPGVVSDSVQHTTGLPGVVSDSVQHTTDLHTMFHTYPQPKVESEGQKQAKKFYEENKNTVNVLAIICASILTISGVKYVAEYIKDIIIAKITNQSKPRRRSPKSSTPKSEPRQSKSIFKTKQSKPRSKTKQSKLRNNLKK